LIHFDPASFSCATNGPAAVAAEMGAKEELGSVFSPPPLPPPPIVAAQQSDGSVGLRRAATGAYGWLALAGWRAGGRRLSCPHLRS